MTLEFRKDGTLHTVDYYRVPCPEKSRFCMSLYEWDDLGRDERRAIEDYEFLARDFP